MKTEWDNFWKRILSAAEVHCKQEWDVLTHFLRNFDEFSRVLLLSDGLKLPFQKHISDPVRRFISVSVHNLYKIRVRIVTRGTIRPGGSSVCFSSFA